MAGHVITWDEWEQESHVSSPPFLCEYVHTYIYIYMHASIHRTNTKKGMMFCVLFFAALLSSSLSSKSSSKRDKDCVACNVTTGTYVDIYVALLLDRNGAVVSSVASNLLVELSVPEPS